MDQRYGAWAQLLALFRLIYRGGRHGGMRIPAREGYLFDPDRYLFLEGRKQRSDHAAIPRVSDGVLYRVLSKLVVLEGERLSYRTLAVEQIGSVYEAIMGFDLHVAQGPSIAIRPAKKHGAPAAVNLEELLRIPGEKSQKWLAETTDQKLSGQTADSLKSAATVDDLLAALERKIARNVTPNVAPRGAMIFQPSNERRRSGSHYTPSTLTGPIVEAAVRPVLRQLGEAPTPEQILNLKVCDPAMGSGAFLVEACRQLGEALVKAWHTHNQAPVVPPDEDELLLAMRQVAQRCLYGVDKNPLAADLAKLSLWLATLAKDHPFTFLDHNLRAGDSLIGLSRLQVAAFTWAAEGGVALVAAALNDRIERATTYRRKVLLAQDDIPYSQLMQELQVADEALSLVREIGDAAIAAFFDHPHAAAREKARKELRIKVEAILKGIVEEDLPTPASMVRPFHWELEFPEVFSQTSGKTGFDVVVGNPPFLGGANIWPTLGGAYRDFLRVIHAETGGKAVDLIAHFIRRAFTLSGTGGTVGLVATNTVAQGDTRAAGLRYVCRSGGRIYAAVKRKAWPGQAAVIVSVIHFSKVALQQECVLDGKVVPGINSFLLGTASEADPRQLRQNKDRAFRGHLVYGMGFTFANDDILSESSPLSVMDELIRRNPMNRERIFPYMGGSELNTSPTQEHHRFIINFADLPENEAARWPGLMKIVNDKVRPERAKLGGYSVAARRSERWWQYGTYAAGLQQAISSIPRCLALSQVSAHHAVAFQPTSRIFADTLLVFALHTYAAFAALQCRVHESWARFLGSSMKNDLRYTISDCFETFPFSEGFDCNAIVEEIGQKYYEARARIMTQYNKGLTAIYNEVHNPDSEWPEIAGLRELHDAMDRAVLDSYGWSDIRPYCNFISESDEDEEEEEGRARRVKYRYRWPDEIRDGILARLLDLNRQRAVKEGRLPIEPVMIPGTVESERKTHNVRRKPRKLVGEFNLNLLSHEEES